jgi:hypothetical protein
MSGFDTRVEGSPGNVRAAASWLRGDLKTAVSGAGDDIVAARSAAMSGFHGLAGQAYADYDKTILTQVDGHTDTIGSAADVFDAYATRLEQCKDRMEAFRGAATTAGLTVTGTVIHEPPAAKAVPPMYGPVTPEMQASYDQQMAAHDDAAGKVAVYDQILSDATNESTSFVDWVDANLTINIDAFDTPAVDALWEVVKSNAGNLGVAIATEGGSQALEGRSNRLKGEAEDLRKARRSGNPARRALGNAPETPGRIRDLLEEAKWLGKGGKLLGPVGIAYDAYNGLESDNPGGGLLAAGLGAGATALVIATAPVSVPTVVVVGGAVVVGVGVSYGVTKGWDALPDGFTDPVDDFVGGAWDGTKDLAGDGWSEVKSWF